MANTLDCTIVDGSKSSRANMNTLGQIPLGKIWNSQSSQLWVKYQHYFSRSALILNHLLKLICHYTKLEIQWLDKMMRTQNIFSWFETSMKPSNNYFYVFYLFIINFDCLILLKLLLFLQISSEEIYQNSPKLQIYQTLKRSNCWCSYGMLYSIKTRLFIWCSKEYCLESNGSIWERRKTSSLKQNSGRKRKHRNLTLVVKMEH